MLLTGKMVLVGTSEYTSGKTGKKYLKVAMAQEADTIDFLTEDFEVGKLARYKEYLCTFSYNPQYKRLGLETIKSV